MSSERPAPDWIQRLRRLVLLLVGLVLAGAAAAAIMLGVHFRDVQDLTERANDYHLASALHAARARDEAWRLLTRYTADEAPPDAVGAILGRDTFHYSPAVSLGLIRDHLDTLKAAQETYGDPRFADLIRRLDRRREALVKSVAGGDPPPHRALPRLITVLGQLEHLHTVRRQALVRQRRDAGRRAIVWLTGGFALLIIVIAVAGSRIMRTIRTLATRQHETAESLRELTEAVDQSPVSVVVTDTDGTIQYVNPQACRNTGYDRDELIGENPRLFKSGETPPETYDDLWDTITAGGVWDGELHNKRKDGSLFWEHARIAPVRDARGRIVRFVGVKQDISRQKAMRAALERSNADLEAFAYAVSHDLQEPLRMITSYLGLLERRCGDGLTGENREFMDYVLDGAKRMQRMIQDLLEYSRITTRGAAPGPVPLEDPVDEALANLETARLEAGAAITVERPLPVVNGDRSQLVRLFQNLVGNALKYTADDAAPRITVTAASIPGGWVEGAVADNGPGIPESLRERVFDVFRRGPDNRNMDGSGVGLALCQRIVRRHGGTIRAECPGDGGTIFRFTLPRPPAEGTGPENP